jgi:hypothetical protein
MKKIIIISLIILAVIACKKKQFSPEGPTDVRIRNLTSSTFNEVIIRTSEDDEDIDTIATINGNSESDYFRFTKAYPKAEISAMINVGGTISTYSTGAVDFTYMQYLGRDKITYEVWISDPGNKKLEIFNVIHDEPLIIK